MCRGWCGTSSLYTTWVEQWTLSFSRAETVLVNSCMPVQTAHLSIISYSLTFYKFMHMTTVIRKEISVRSAMDIRNYFAIITALTTVTQANWETVSDVVSLWCETKKLALNLVRINVQLSHTLADRVTDAWWQHYFINNCNLIDNSFNGTNVGGYIQMQRLKWHCHSTVAGALYKIIVSNSCSAVFRRRTHETVLSSVPGGGCLMSADETRLLTWFVDSYIRKRSQLWSMPIMPT